MMNSNGENKTRRLALICAAALCLALSGVALSGCGSTSSNTTNENNTSNQQTTDNTANNSEDTSNASSSSKKSSADLSLLVAPWDNNTPTTSFSNERAWVTSGIGDDLDDFFLEPGDHIVIDEEGRAIYTVPDQGELSFFRCGEFNDAGYSYYMAQGKEKVQNTTDDISPYPVTNVIIDKDGNEIYRLESPDGDSEYAIMGSDGKNFLVFEKTVGFDSNDAYFYMIDENGKQVGEKAKVPDESRKGGSSGNYIVDPVKMRGQLVEPYATYLGEGIFSLQKAYRPTEAFPIIYNSKTAQVFELTQLQVVGDFDDGSIMVAKNTDDYLLDLPLSALESEETYTAWEKESRPDGIAMRVEKTDDGKVPQEILSDVLSGSRGVKLDLRGEHTMWRNPDLPKSSKWYDDIPALPTQYKDKDVSIANVSPTFDGITAVEMKGADGDYYYVLMDADGNELYDRIELPMTSTGAVLYMMCSEKSHELRRMEGETTSSNDSNLLFMASDGTTFYVHEDKLMKISPKGETSEVAEVPSEKEALLAIDGNYLYFNHRIYDFKNDKWLEGISTSSDTKTAEKLFSADAKKSSGDKTSNANGNSGSNANSSNASNNSNS